MMIIALQYELQWGKTGGWLKFLNLLERAADGPSLRRVKPFSFWFPREDALEA